MGYFAPDKIMIEQMLETLWRRVEIDVLIAGEEIDVSVVRAFRLHGAACSRQE